MPSTRTPTTKGPDAQDRRSWPVATDALDDTDVMTRAEGRERERALPSGDGDDDGEDREPERHHRRLDRAPTGDDVNAGRVAMKSIFPELEGAHASWMRTGFITVVLLVILAVGWIAFAVEHERTPRGAFGGSTSGDDVGR